jgi:hypothetical protein
VTTDGEEMRAGDAAGPGTAAVDLYWLPLGAGGHFVRLNGRVYEALAARLQRRRACALYHSALQIGVGQERFVIEQAPVHDWSGKERGSSPKALSAVAGRDDFGSSATRSVFGPTDMFRTSLKPWTARGD